MSRNRKSKRPERAKAAIGSPARKKRRVGLFSLIAVLVVGLGAYFGFARESEPQYLPQDVVRENPILAKHEMGPGPAIPFLPAAQAQPRIEIPHESYNFGRIGPHDVVTRTFVIHNTGDAPLTISRAFTTCGCTQAKVTARVIPPGKVALATLRFDAGFHNTRGETVQRGLILENNDPKNPRAEVWVLASVSQF